jgi:hypothetical protein
LALLLSACSHFPYGPRSIGSCPGEIRSTDEIPGQFTLRQRVTVTTENLNFPFELIVQKKGRELVLIGLSPLGAKLFTVVQTGSETEVQALPGVVLPIPPLNVLRDLNQHGFPMHDASGVGSEPTVIDRPDCDYAIRFETLSEERSP